MHVIDCFLVLPRFGSSTATGESRSLAEDQQSVLLACCIRPSPLPAGETPVPAGHGCLPPTNWSACACTNHFTFLDDLRGRTDSFFCIGFVSKSDKYTPLGLTACAAHRSSGIGPLMGRVFCVGHAERGSKARRPHPPGDRSALHYCPFLFAVVVLVLLSPSPWRVVANWRGEVYNHPATRTSIGAFCCW